MSPGRLRSFPSLDIGVFQLLPRGRATTGAADDAIEREIGEMYVLRRICVADTDAEALRTVQEPLRWHYEMATHVHERSETIDALHTLDDDASMIETPDGGECFGSVATVIRQLDELRALGLRKVIGWFHFGNMPYASVRRSMQLVASEVIPKYCRDSSR